MYEIEMPQKRQFNPVPKFETVVRLSIRLIVLLTAAGALWFTALFAWHRTPWGSPEVQAAVPQASTKQEPPREQHQAAAASVIDPAQLDDLKASACTAWGLDYDGQRCVKPPPPKPWSAKGIRERSQPAGEAIEGAGQAVEDAGKVVRDSLQKYFRKSENVEDRRGEYAEEDAPPPRRYGRMADSGPQPGLRMHRYGPGNCPEGMYWNPTAWFGVGGCLYDHGDR